MFTQGMKRWLQHLFAWWPWKRADEIDYTQATDTLSRGTMQESPFRTAIDNPYARPTRPAPQPIITISLEPTEDDETPTWPPIVSSLPSTPITASPLPLSPLPDDEDEESVPRSELYDKRPTLRLPPPNQQKQEANAPTASGEPLGEFSLATQQRLKFLRYLVEQGVVSDDIR